MAKRFNGDFGPALFGHILDQGFAGQPVLAVDDHGIRAAHPVGAALAKAEGAVLIPFDMHECVQQAVVGLRFDLVVLEIGLRIRFRIETLDLEGDFHP